MLNDEGGFFFRCWYIPYHPVSGSGFCMLDTFFNNRFTAAILPSIFLFLVFVVAFILFLYTL